MFKPTPMRKANIFLSEGSVLDLTIALGRLGILHLDQSAITEEWQTEASTYWSRQADNYASLRRRLENLLDNLGVPREEGGMSDDLAPRQDARDMEDRIREAEDVLRDWQERKRAAEQRVQRLELDMKATRLLRPLEISMDSLRELSQLYLAIGTIPWRDLTDLEIAIFRIPFVIIPTFEQKGRVLIFAATTRENAPILDVALESAFFEPLALPQDATGSPEEELADLEGDLKEARERLEALEAERQKIATERGQELLELWRRARDDTTVADMVSKYGRHGETYLIVGWVPQPELDKLVKAVKDVSEEGADLEILEPRLSLRRMVPTLLHNPPFLKPFEKIVSNFGFPRYDEIDPTPLVALTFVAMYGMMFGDVGHGLLLALAGVWLLRRGGSLDWLGRVIVAVGLSGALFGVLYGSLFGIEDILPHLWLNPFRDIMTILLISIGGGAVLLSVGFVLSLLSAWRSRTWQRLFLGKDGLAGFVLYISLIGGGALLLQGSALPIPLWGGVILAAAAVLWFQEPLGRLFAGERPLLADSWIEHLVQSLFELFETLISYFTNSLSFVRLGAFAIAHAGLSQVVLVLSDGASGWVRWLIIGVGALIIVGFEGLLVGIQTLRLEYYEFFGKFFQGGGVAFKPFVLPEGREAQS